MKLPTEKSKITRSLSKSLTVAYGRNKIGKSEFFSHMNDAIFLATEPGLDEVEVYKIDCHSHEDYLEALRLLCQGKSKYKTIITDTFDAWVTMINDWVCRKYSVSHVSELDHNRGYYFVTQEIDRVITKIAQQFGLVFICHDGWEKVKTKTQAYDRQTLDVTGKNRKLILKKANYILLFNSDEKGDEEVRYILTRGNKYAAAGHRGNFLPEKIPLKYEEFIKYFKEEEK